MKYGDIPFYPCLIFTGSYRISCIYILIFPCIFYRKGNFKAAKAGVSGMENLGQFEACLPYFCTHFVSGQVKNFNLLVQGQAGKA